MRIFTVSVLALALAAGLFAGEVETTAKHWKTGGEFTIAVAEAMPAADYNFAPNPEEMGFGKLMIHVTGYNTRLCGMMSGLKGPEMPAKLAAAMKDPKGTFDKETTVQYVKDSFAFCDKAMATLTPEKLDAVSGEGARQMSGRERLWGAFTHIVHHRGQAEVYLRVKNIKPPDYKF